MPVVLCAEGNDDMLQSVIRVSLSSILREVISLCDVKCDLMAGGVLSVQFHA